MERVRRLLPLWPRAERGKHGLRTQSQVPCPRSEQLEPVQRCVTCGYGGPVIHDSHRRPAFVYCAVPLTEATLPSPWLDVPPSEAEPGTLAEVLTRPVIAVTPETSLDTVAWLLLERDLTGVPVIDEQEQPVGIVSKTDVLLDSMQQTRARNSPGLDSELAARFGLDPEAVEVLSDRIASDVMTPLVFSLSEDATVHHAAALMASEQVHRLPVVSPSGRLVGIVTPMDLIRWMAVGAGYRSAGSRLP